MPIVTIYVATPSQVSSLENWRGHVHFPGDGQQCFALQGARLGGEAEFVDELTKLGYRAKWHAKLGAVVVDIQRDKLDEAGKKIQAELRLFAWPAEWVTNKTRRAFGA